MGDTLATIREGDRVADCIRLERERDEARRGLEAARWGQYAWEARLGEVEHERDDARAQLESLPIVSGDAMVEAWLALTAERDAWRKKAEVRGAALAYLLSEHGYTPAGEEMIARTIGVDPTLLQDGD
jgi:hypothetical protein